MKTITTINQFAQVNDDALFTLWSTHMDNTRAFPEESLEYEVFVEKVFNTQNKHCDMYRDIQWEA